MIFRFVITACAAMVLAMSGLFAPVYAMLAGSSRVELEVPEDAPLAGHVYRQGRSAQVTHDPVYARCLYIDEDQFDIALVSLDVWGITPELRARVLELRPDGLNPEEIILVATGNHSGPGGIARAWELRQHYGRYMPEMVEALANGAVAAIEEAMLNSTRATIGFSIGSQDSLTQSIAGGDAPKDRDIGVIRVDDSDGSPIALLGSLSTSVETLGVGNGLAMSSEFPGVFCNELEQLSAEGTVAFFLNGASGDQQIAAQEGRTDFALTEYVGKELAVVVKGIANTISCDELAISSNFSPVTPPRIPDRPYVSSKALVQTVEIGALLVSFVPGAPVFDLKTSITTESTNRGYAGHIMVGLANDNLGILGKLAGESAPSEIQFSEVDWLLETIVSLMRRGANP